jgi:hypothetical protein
MTGQLIVLAFIVIGIVALVRVLVSDARVRASRRAATFGAKWHPDPAGRFALRYWDGRAWTGHVADATGHAAVDPL